MSAAPPLVRPGEGNRAAGAFGERGPDVHRGELRLPRVPFADAVDARFGDEQRLVAGDVLQPCQVRPKLALAMQVDVEGADIEERQIEELGRWKVDVGKQAGRCG